VIHVLTDRKPKFERVRNLLLSFDGAMLYADIYRDFGTVSFHAGVGRSVIDENVEWSFLLSLLLDMCFDPDPSLPPHLDPGTTDLFFGIASFQCTNELSTLIA
jgi:hypothetical protein